MRFMVIVKATKESRRAFCLAAPAGNGKRVQIEVRRLLELEDLGPIEAVYRFQTAVGACTPNIPS